MDGNKPIRKMTYFSGISFWIIPALILLVAYFVFDAKKKKEEKEMLLSITQKEYAEERQK